MRVSAFMVAFWLAMSPLWSASAQGAGASPSPAVEAEERSRRGVELYQEGRYAEAISEMLAAYQLVADPGLLYNIGRIYQQMGEVELALDYLTRFVKEPGADPGRVQKALGHIKALREAQQAAAAAPVDEAAPVEEAVSEPLEVVEVSQGPDRTLVWVVGGVGVASLVFGGVLGGLAWSASEDVTGEGGSFETRRDAQSRGRALALGADIGLGVGVAALTTAVVLYAVSGDEAPPGEEGAEIGEARRGAGERRGAGVARPPWSVSPWFGEGAWGVGAEVRFE